MAGATWLDLLAAAVGGGLTVKVIDIIYQEIRRRSEQAGTAKHFVDEHITPLLKAADELVGKLRASAEDDFRGFPRTAIHDGSRLPGELASLTYLFARFWAHIEIFRRDGLSIPLGSDDRGKKLLSFFDCFESQRVRIVDRISQRAIGELLAERLETRFEAVTYVRFMESYESDPAFRQWVAPLVQRLTRMRHTYDRQRLLQYGVVVHALIDTLDPQHLVTRERPAYPNKLSRRTWQSLRYRVFGLYLQFVPGSSKYLGKKK